MKATAKMKVQKPYAPKILVLHEKHGIRLFDAKTKEALLASALKIVSERFKDEYWYYAPDKPEGKPSMTLEAIKALPEGRARAAGVAEWDEYMQDLTEYERLQEEWETIKRAVKEKNGELAWQVLQDRRDAEYEGFNLENLESGE